MKASINILKMALSLSAIFLTLNSWGQDNQIELVHTDKLTNSIIFKDAIKAVGNVHFKTTDMDMYCDSAFFHKVENWIRAYGRVQINQGDTLNLFSDSLYFDGNTNIGVLKSHVRIRDNLYKLTTDSLKFNASESKAYYTNHAIIKSNQQNILLTSVKGTYSSSSKLFSFKDSVTLTHPNYKVNSDTLEFNALTEKVLIHGPSIITLDSTTIVYCKKGIYDTKTDLITMWTGATINTEQQIISGDSLMFNQSNDFALGYNNIIIKDTIEDLLLKSNYILKENNTITLADQAQIIRIQKDTLVLQADTIIQIKNNENKAENYAYSNVIIEKGEIIGICDSLYFNEQDSVIKMMKNPILWREQIEIKSDSIQIILIDNEIKNFYLFQNAFIAMQHDSTYFDQISGDLIKATLDSGKINSVDVLGSAETIYFPNEKEKDTITNKDIKIIKGHNHMISTKIKVEFINSEIENVIILDSPEGVFKALKGIDKKNLYLSKFSWKINKKPQSLLTK